MSKEKLHIDDYFKEKVKSQQVNGAIPSFDDFLSNSGVENLVNSGTGAETSSSVSSGAIKSLSVTTKAIISFVTAAAVVGVGFYTYFSNEDTPTVTPEEITTDKQTPDSNIKPINKVQVTLTEDTLSKTIETPVIIPSPTIGEEAIPTQPETETVFSPTTNNNLNQDQISKTDSSVEETVTVKPIIAERPTDSLNITNTDTIVKVTPIPVTSPSSKTKKKKTKKKPSSGFNLFEKAD